MASYFNFWYSLLALSVLFYAVDNTKSRTSSLLGRLSLWLHHFANLFLHWGWLLNNITWLKVYIVTVVSVVLMWTFADRNLCPWTTWHHQLNAYTRDPYLHDLWYWLGLKKSAAWNRYGQAVWLLLMAAVAFYKIQKISK